MAFHGAFIFRKQDHGILSSTYFNNGEFVPYPETAKLKVRDANCPEDIFAGAYETIWLEKSAYYICDMIITPHTVPNVYKIRWMNENNGRDFEGYGMLENGALVGFFY